MAICKLEQENMPICNWQNSTSYILKPCGGLRNVQLWKIDWENA